MNESRAKEVDALPLSAERRVDEVCNAFEAAWKAGRQPRIESYLRDTLEPERSALLRELLKLDLAYATGGADFFVNDYVTRFPEHGELVRAVLQAATPKQQLISTTDDRAGTQIDEEEPILPEIPGYEILGVLGHGAMGVVYKARHIVLKRIDALKMILAGMHAAPDQLLRFRNEAETVARFEHPNIVHIYAIGAQDGLPYFALEFVAGGSLHQKLARTPQTPREAARLVETLACAMHYAHERGVIHRDLKPGNVLLTADGIPKITDFGLAKQLDAETSPTLTTAIMGTPSYMAPEQAEGRIKEISPRSDVYALGAILYEMLTGRPPFQAASLKDTLELVCNQEPVPPSRLQPKVPRDLETICLKCLEKEKRKRYSSAAELADRLRLFLEGKPIPDRPVGKPERLWRWAKRKPLVAGLSAAVLISLILGLGLTSLFAARASQKAADALDEKGRADRKAQEALANEIEANNNAFQANEARRRAEENEKLALQRFHAAQINLAQREWQESHVVRVLEILEGLRPQKPEEEDLRGFEWHYLYRLCHQERLTLRGHTGFVFGVAFSSDGNRVASSASDGTVRIWDARTGAGLLILRHEGDGESVAFSPDGKFVVAGGASLTIWDAHTGKVLTNLPGPWFRPVYTPDGKQLAAIQPGRVVLLDTATGKRALTLAERNFMPGRVALSPDGSRVAAVGQTAPLGKPVVKVWNLATARLTHTLAGRTSYLQSVAFSPDSKTVAAGGFDHTVQLWDSVTGAEVRTFKGGTGTVNEVAFSPDGKWIAAGAQDQPDSDSSHRSVHLWEVETGRLLGVFKAHTGGVTAVAFSPDRLSLASGSLDQTVKIWNSKRGEDSVTLDTSHESARVWKTDFAWGQNGQRLLWADGQQLKSCDFLTGERLVSLPRSALHLALSPDGASLATVEHHAGSAKETRIHLFDTRSGEEKGLLDGHSSYIHALAFSADGDRLASAGCGQTLQTIDTDPGQIKVWDVRRRRLLRSLDGYRGPVYSLAFHPDGHRLASGGRDGKVRLWDAVTGRELRSFPARKGWFSRVAFSPDGRLLAAAEYTLVARRATTTALIRLWDVAAGQELPSLKGHHATVNSLAFTGGSPLAATTRRSNFGTQLLARSCSP